MDAIVAEHRRDPRTLLVLHQVIREIYGSGVLVFQFTSESNLVQYVDGFAKGDALTTALGVTNIKLVNMAWAPEAKLNIDAKLRCSVTLYQKWIAKDIVCTGDVADAVRATTTPLGITIPFPLAPSVYRITEISEEVLTWIEKFIPGCEKHFCANPPFVFYEMRTNPIHIRIPCFDAAV